MLIRKIMNDYNIKLTQLAKKLSISKSYASMLDHGTRMPSLNVLKKIKTNFNYTYDEMFELITIEEKEDNSYEDSNNPSNISSESFMNNVNPSINKEFEKEIKRIEKIEEMFNSKIITDEERKKLRNKVLGIS